MKVLRTLMAVVSSFGVAQLAHAAVMLDQSYSTYGGEFCYQSSNYSCGQSFTAAQDNIAGAGVFLSVAPSEDTTISFSIYSSYGATPSGLIASANYLIPANAGGWHDAYWSPAALTAGTTYYLVLDWVSGGAAWIGGNYDGYFRGTMLLDGVSSSWYDLNFRTWYSDSASVPEPGTLALFGLGLAGLGLSRRRKAN